MPVYPVGDPATSTAASIPAITSEIRQRWPMLFDFMKWVACRGRIMKLVELFFIRGPERPESRRSGRQDGVHGWKASVAAGAMTV